MESILEAALKDWKEREQRYEKLFSPSVLKSREFLKEKLRHYDELRARVIADPAGEQRLAIKALELERKQLARRVYPNIFRRLLDRIVSGFRIESAAVKLREERHEHTESLRDTMARYGVGSYFNQVQQQMKQGNREFSLPVSYQISEQGKMDLQFNFKKLDNGNYLLENYRATLHSAIEKGKPRQHTFDTRDSEIINAEKAYNLLSGRAVQQADSNAWKQLDFNDKDAAGNFRIRHFNENYGYNLERALAGLPVKEDQRIGLSDKLREGEKVIATLVISGKEHAVSIAADPIKKDVAIYDVNGQKVTLEQIKDNAKVQRSGSNVKQLQPKQAEQQSSNKSKSVKL